MTLTNEYQYIGRSNSVRAYGDSFYFYILLYAKTNGSTATGKHSVSVKMRLACTVDSTFYGYYTTANAKVNGSTAFSWSSQQIPGSAWGSGSITEGGVTYKRYTDLKEGTVEVDTQYAQKDVSITASWERLTITGTPPSWLPKITPAEASITVTLPLIPSASTITSAADVTLGNACIVKWTPKAASFSYKLKFSTGSWSKTTDVIHPNKNTEYIYTEYTIPLEAANQIKTKTGKMTVTLYTYSDSNATSQIGSADTEEFTVTVPETDDTRPTVTMVIAPLDSPIAGLYIQGKSKLEASLDISTKYGASVDDSYITVDGIVYDSSYLTKVGEQEVKGVVKDSRGHYGTATQKITVIAYSKPLLQAASGESNIVAARCDSNGKLSDSGTYLKIKAKISYEKVMSDKQNNFGKIQYRYRAEGGSWPDWVTILDAKSTADTEVTKVLLGTLDIKTNYQVQVRAIDTLTTDTTPVTLVVSSDDVYMDRPAYGKSMGLGGYSSGNGNLDVYWRIKARNGLSLFTAVGEEMKLDSILPLPRGEIVDNWNPNSISNGVYYISTYPLKDEIGSVLMETGVLIQMSATVNGSMKIQMAFPTDSFTPVYRIMQEGSWTPWNTFKI